MTSCKVVEKYHISLSRKGPKAIWKGWDRCSNTSVGQQESTCRLANRPAGYGAGLLLSIRKLALFGKWPGQYTNGIAGRIGPAK